MVEFKESLEIAIDDLKELPYLKPAQKKLLQTYMMMLAEEKWVIKPTINTQGVLKVYKK